MNKRFDFDREKLKNFDYIIGTDEAGRGPGAGPVFAAAVCFTSLDKNLIKKLDKLNDSKQLSEKIREELFEIIINNSIYSIKQGSVEEIEKLNILRTSLLTMNKSCCEAAEKLDSENILVLVDGNKKIPDFKYEQQFIVKGDYKSASIAAASILAKVSRDIFMKELDKEFPQYRWAENKGYLTQAHLDAVDKFGLTKWHRKKFLQKHFEKSEQLSLL
ncbi:MAG: ribonuclease HII [Candidatus Gastranaerophilales bacterium]|nr:ribonuclease HII [Candidatus Gastranaerophilales bacterium]